MPAPLLEITGFIPRKSKGHIAFWHGYEYLSGEKYVFRADMLKPIECTDRRECALFVCTIEEWNDYKSRLYLGILIPARVTA